MKRDTLITATVIAALAVMTLAVMALAFQTSLPGWCANPEGHGNWVVQPLCKGVRNV